MKIYVSVNCKGELHPFMPAVAHKDKSTMERFVTRFNNGQCEIGATDTDDMAIVEEREVFIKDEMDGVGFLTPSAYWEVMEND